tara:strand:- start:157 stop:3552 length:3396 start_codon:yes stop_codon:yes gene_type:complete
MNLPGIIGSGQTESLIILYSFIQQNLLFEALAGLRGLSTGIGFLSYLATVFSMIGLLILIFSPSLWKLKYAGCWFALFIIVNLGGSVGPEFGYNFNKLASFGQGSQPIVAQNQYKCGASANNGAGGCQQLYAGDQILVDNQRATFGDVESVGMRMQKNTNGVANGEGQRMVGVAADGSFDDLNIIGFLPQVVVLYITNTLRDALQEAMNELVEAEDLSKMASVADLMVHAEVPNEQVKLMTKAFNDVCGGVNDKKATDILSMISTEQEVYKSDLSGRSFKPNDIIHLSSLVNKDNNPKQVEPLMMFPEYNADGTTLNKLTLEFMEDPAYDVFKKAYVLNRTADDHVTLDKDATEQALQNNQPIYKTFNDMDQEYIKSELYNGSVYETKYNDDQKKLKEQTAKFLKSKYASIPVKMLIPTYDIPKSEVEQFAEQQADQTQSIWSRAGGCQGDSCTQILEAKKAKYDTNKQLLGKMNKGNFREVNNCYDLMKEQSLALDLAIKTNLEDLDDQLRYVTNKQLAGVTHHLTSSGAVKTRINGEDVDTAKVLSANGSVPKGMLTAISLSNVLSEEQMKCVLKSSSAGNCDEIQKDIDRYIALYKQSAIQNATATPVDSRVNIGYQDDSAAGLANAITKGFVDVATGPVSWFAEIGASIKAGAYAAVLPIIKNIVIAFILVLTPILLLMGLLVPSWAPGVIITVIVALLYIKMVDVTMVLMDGILSITKDIFESIYNGGNSFSDGNPLNKAYLNFMDTIWAMAYMSSFLITAFLMFAAGNSKAVISKLTGMDGTVKGVGNDVLNTGIKATKNVIGLAAPTMGNTLISSTALRNGLTSATAGIATFSATPNPLTTLSQQHQKKSIDNLKEADGIRADTSKTFDPETQEYTSSIMADYNQEKAIKNAEYSNPLSNADKTKIHKEKLDAAKDKNAIMKDEFKTKIENREDKALRGFTREEPEVTRIENGVISRSESNMKSHGLNEDERFSDSTFTHTDEYGNTTSSKIKGSRTRLSKDLFRTVLNNANHDNIENAKDREKVRTNSRRITMATINEIAPELRKNSKTNFNSDGTRTHTLNKNYEDIVKGISKKLTAKGGEAISESDIKKGLSSFFDIDSNGNMSISDTIVSKKSRKPKSRK